MFWGQMGTNMTCLGTNGDKNDVSGTNTLESTV